MLIVQLGHLHIHTHNLQEPGNHEVHVLGGHAHQQSHDQSNEIDLLSESLMIKVKIVPDLLPLVLFILLVLTPLTLRTLLYELVVNFLRQIIFALRPPSRASP